MRQWKQYVAYIKYKLYPLLIIGSGIIFLWLTWREMILEVGVLCLTMLGLDLQKERVSVTLKYSLS